MLLVTQYSVRVGREEYEMEQILKSFNLQYSYMYYEKIPEVILRVPDAL